MADVVVIKWQDVEGLPEGARVQTNKQTGTTSAFFPYYFRDEKGEPKQERDYIGSVVDGKFEPNLYYFKNHPTRENRPLENWKDPGQRAKAEAALAINKKVEKVEASPSHKYELDETTKEDQIRQVGATALCMNILRRIGMVEDIARTLNYDPVLVMHVINLAIFYALTAKATYLASSEANVAKFIGAGCLTSQRASELFTRIGGNLDLSTRFNKTRIARLVASGDLLAIDGTFMDCNSSKISVAKKGKRKNGTFGPQINFSLMANVSQGYPLGYRYYSGDTNDVTTLDDLIQLWIDAGLNKKNVELLIDRGYCATDRLKTLDSEGFKFVACAKTNLTWIKNAIMNRNSEFYSPLSQLLHHYCFGIQEKMPNSDSMKATIFFNPNKQMCETREMREDLEKVRKRCKEETISLEHPLMNFLKDPVLGEMPEIDKHKFELECYLHGFFACISNIDASTDDILSKYCQRNEAEVLFGLMLNNLQRTTRVQSSQALEGSLFVMFIALCILAHLRHLMQKEEIAHVNIRAAKAAYIDPNKVYALNDYMTVSEMLSSLKSVMAIKSAKTKQVRLVNVTNPQKELLRVMGYEGLFDDPEKLWDDLSAKRLWAEVDALKAQDQAAQTVL